MLTDVKLRSLKPRDAVYRKADTNGLCIEVTPAGSKLWRYRYRFNGKASMVGLGEYPDVSLVAARAKRDEYRRAVVAGQNPTALVQLERARTIERSANTFGAVANEWLAQRTLPADAVARERRMIEKDLNPFMGDVPIDDVTAPALLIALRRIESRGSLVTAHRTRSMAGQIFRYAIATGRTRNNPAKDLIGALVQPDKSHFASVVDSHTGHRDLAKVGALLRALWGYEGTAVVRAALKLAPMTFVRPGELRRARWADIDLDAAEWCFIASKTKQPHIVPLSTQAVAVLRELHAITGRSALVFPSIRSILRPMSENTVSVALKALGYDGDTMTGHGFRAMARTILDEVLGFRPDFIEHQLAHAVKDPNGRAYNRTAHLPERKKMMQAWADYLDALRNENNVVALKGSSRRRSA